MIIPGNRRITPGKVEILEQELLQELQSGKFIHDDRFYSVREVSEKYQVTMTTAYRALSGLIRQRYLTGRNGLGVYVNLPETRPLQLVAVPLRLRGNPQVLDFYEALSAVAEKRGIRLLMGNGEHCDTEIAFLQKAIAVSVDGVIRFPCGVGGVETRVRKELSRHQLPCVAVNDWWRAGCFPTVKTDETDGLNRIMDALYAVGHRKIALVQETFNAARPEIQRAFWRWHWEHDLPMESDNICYCLSGGLPMALSLHKMRQSGVTALLFSYGINIHDIWDRENRELLPQFTLAALDDIPLAETELFAAYRHDDVKMAEKAFDLLENFGCNPVELVEIPGKLIINTNQNRLTT